MKKGPKPNEPRITRECHHPRARHRHGTVQAYNQDRCRCQLCSDASWRVQKARRTFGGNTLVDAAPTAERLNDLIVDPDISFVSIGRFVDMAHTELARIARGERQRVLASTRDAILGLDLDDVRNPFMLDVTASALRVQALAACGWSFSAISRDADVSLDMVREIATRDVESVSKHVHVKIAACYERLWKASPPASNRWERGAIGAARNRARRLGWKMPMDVEHDLQELDQETSWSLA